mmetsp:Transcript_3873/g.5917  ORF Transcript_3873/g.5917 Transcript_3873/m.5917 type:complete len:370 (-) Transcript_3873:874-1983(-)
MLHGVRFTQNRLLFLLLFIVLNNSYSTSHLAMSSTSDRSGSCSGMGKTVMITGANGYIASWICKQLLEKGYTIHVCVRDASISAKVEHLRKLPNADTHLKLFSTGNLGETKGCFNEAMVDCDAIIHSATPLGTSGGDGEKKIFQPAIRATQDLLDSITKTGKNVKTLILTSSMSSIAPRPEPEIKDESNWSDPVLQKTEGRWYGATKTTQEQIVQKWVENQADKEFKYASICPTVVLGPSLNTAAKPSGTQGKLQKWLTGDLPETAWNDSMSFVHVEDCAKMHVAALELPDASGRYMCLVESLHWNEICAMLKEIHPKMKSVKPYEGGDKAKPTQFNLDKRNTLGIQFAPTVEILTDAVAQLHEMGELD